MKKLTALQWKKIRASGGSSIKEGYRAFKRTAYAVVFVNKDMVIQYTSIYPEPHPTANLKYYSIVVDQVTANSYSQAEYRLRRRLYSQGHWLLQYMPGGFCVDEKTLLPEELREPAIKYFAYIDSLKKGTN